MSSRDSEEEKVHLSKIFFPDSWEPEKIMEGIIEAYNNFEGVPKTDKTTGLCVINSRTNDGIEVRIIIQESDSEARIVTAYPDPMLFRE